jgi:hypothetical protein
MRNPIADLNGYYPGQTASRQVEIASATLRLQGDLEHPANAHSAILFAHGPGSGRFNGNDLQSCIAGRLSEEPVALEAVMRFAADRFLQQLHMEAA